MTSKFKILIKESIFFRLFNLTIVFIKYFLQLATRVLQVNRKSDSLFLKFKSELLITEKVLPFTDSQIIEKNISIRCAL